jgi:hypothetical protein
LKCNSERPPAARTRMISGVVTDCCPVGQVSFPSTLHVRRFARLCERTGWYGLFVAGDVSLTRSLDSHVVVFRCWFGRPAPSDRYTDIIPNPATMVRLPEEDGGGDRSTYINANYMRGYDGKPKTYIAAQGKRSTTYSYGKPCQSASTPRNSRAARVCRCVPIPAGLFVLLSGAVLTCCRVTRDAV